MKSNNGILTEKEIQARTKFWNKKQFRTWTNKELERSSKNMQALLAALKETTASELAAILKMNSYEVLKYPVESKEYIIWTANKNDLEYAISIAPKNF